MVFCTSWCLLGLWSSEGYIELQWFKMALSPDWHLMLAVSKKFVWSFWPEHICTAPLCGLDFSLQGIWVLRSIQKERKLKLPDFCKVCLHSEVFERYSFVSYCSKQSQNQPGFKETTINFTSWWEEKHAWTRENIIICNHLLVLG